MQKHELIQALEGLADETDIIVRVIGSGEVRYVIDTEYVKMRGDEPACMSLVITSQASGDGKHE